MILEHDVQLLDSARETRTPGSPAPKAFQLRRDEFGVHFRDTRTGCDISLQQVEYRLNLGLKLAAQLAEFVALRAPEPLAPLEPKKVEGRLYLAPNWPGVRIEWSEDGSSSTFYKPWDGLREVLRDNRVCVGNVKDVPQVRIRLGRTFTVNRDTYIVEAVDSKKT